MNKLLVRAARALLLCAACASPAAAQVVEVLPSLAVPNQISTDAASSLTMSAPRGALLSLTVKIGAVSGYVMVLNAASLPANGAVTPYWCAPVSSDGTTGSLSAEWRHGMLRPAGQALAGVTVAFSTTGCDTLTASATAKFMGQAL